MRSADVVVAGAGVLGASLSFWLSSLFDCEVLVVDPGRSPALHSSSRNTGVVHRPFYLDPSRKGVFARSALLSYPLWRSLSESHSLPWSQVGTLEVALGETGLGTLRKYSSWGRENGMAEEELDLLDARKTKALEPEVECAGALYSKADASVDFRAFTRKLVEFSQARGVRFLAETAVVRVEEGREAGVTVELEGEGGKTSVRSRLFINAAGGSALRLARTMGLGRSYGALHFRGEYWVVAEPFASSVGRNVYVTPKHNRLPFLDPHLVVRADGSRQVGPNAVPVTGPHVYQGLGLRDATGLLEPPLSPKLRLLADPEFLALLSEEWRSSLSKAALCDRVRRFVPRLSKGMLVRRGVSGVRSPLIGEEGFVPEAVLLHSGHSCHILNFNSPGATGAPAFSAKVVKELIERGCLDGLHPSAAQHPLKGWDFVEVAEGFRNLSDGRRQPTSTKT